MKCAVHTDVDATGYCRNCGKPMCSVCARPVRDVLYCEECLATVMGHPAPVASAPATTPAPSPYAPPPAAALPVARPAGSSSPAVAFILGFFPGLGAIYNGQYNKGLIHIAIFASIIVALSTDLGAGLEPMLGIFLPASSFTALLRPCARHKPEISVKFRLIRLSPGARTAPSGRSSSSVSAPCSCSTIFTFWTSSVSGSFGL